MYEKHSEEQLREAIKCNISVSGVLRHLNIPLAGGNHFYISRKIKSLGLDTSHFLGRASGRNKPNKYKKSWQEILIFRKDKDIRQDAKRLCRALIESGREYTCVCCGLGNSWAGLDLVLEIHHRDGNWLNDESNNVDFICPNCHSQMTNPKKEKPLRKKEFIKKDQIHEK